MTAAASIATDRNVPHRPWTLGLSILLLAVAAVIVLTLLSVKSPLRGWFVALAAWSTIPFGSMVLLLIHRLTGGEWGRAARPVLAAAAGLCPMAAIAFVPVLAFLPDIYPWAAKASAIPADVARFYLNEPLYQVRTVVTLVGWSLLAIVFAIGAGHRLAAGVGLAFFGLTISLVSVDWFLSLDPHYVATAFATMISVQQLLAALAAVAVLGSHGLDRRAAADLGALMIAALLGVIYLELMTFIVSWYGDLPDKASWYVRRQALVWEGVLGGALLSGALVPFAMLLLERVRRSRGGVRVAGLLILFGTALHFAWLLVPAFPDQALVCVFACGALVILSAVSLLIGSALLRLFAPYREADHAQ